MRALALVNQTDSGIGVFREAIADAGWELVEWRILDGEERPMDPLEADAVFSLGGAMNVDQTDRFPALRDETAILAEVHANEIPLLGVCLGAQLVSGALGGSPRRSSEPEIGWHEVKVTPEGELDPLLDGLGPSFEAFQWHSYETAPPDDVVVLARSPVCVQAFRAGTSTWAIQFHAEVSAADALHWISIFDTDPDAVRIGVDPEVLGPETERRMPDWNATGRELCDRFLAAATEIRTQGASPG
ncbi:type 1 glutamine amidotransferase [Thermoleophilia bacterium SCSIO 60948]|nr:type 1 glutamine amidotransferase [Thermoleophilia bacterium SCSIO 60948]